MDFRECEKKISTNLGKNVAIDRDLVRAFNNRGNDVFHNSREQYDRPFCHRMVISAFNRWSSLREMLMKTFHKCPRVLRQGLRQKLCGGAFKRAQSYFICGAIVTYEMCSPINLKQYHRKRYVLQ